MTGNNENPTNEIARVQDRFQMTIPRMVREHLNLSPGDLLQFEIKENNGGICVHKAIPVKAYQIQQTKKPCGKGKHGDGEESPKKNM